MLDSTPMGFPRAKHSVADAVLNAANLEWLTIRGASLRGDEHRYNAETRQDAMGMWELGFGDARTAVLVCVADGVGSQPISQQGSAYARRYLWEEVPPLLETLLSPKQDESQDAAADSLIDQIKRRLAEERATELGVPPKELSTTLTAALVERAPDGPPHHGLLLAVGDSPAFLLSGGQLRPLTAAGDDQDASAPTDALPMAVGRVHTRSFALDSDEMLLMCTDGLSNPMRNASVRGQLISWWQADQPPGMLEFAWQLSFRAKSFSDDRTAVCAWGRGEGERG